MNTHPLSHVALTAAWLALASCGGDPTAPVSAPASGQVSAARAGTESDTWVTRRDLLPFPWTGMVTALIPVEFGGSILYAIGGAGENRSCLGRVRAYNVNVNYWRAKASLPLALCDINGAGVIGGKIYVAGGSFNDRSKPPSAALFAYDPATDAWTRKRSMPEGGSGGIAGVIEDKLYVVTNTPSGSRFFRYDPATDRWQTLPSTAYYSLGAGFGVINGKLYLIAQAVKEYDPATNRWTTKGPLPGDLHGACAVVHGKLYLFGADTRSGSEQWGIFIYDPVGNTWTRKPLLTTLQDTYNPNGAHRVIRLGKSRVEVVGGTGQGNNQQYVP
jgi:N-acetylneuraminic acid mutarotase